MSPSTHTPEILTNFRHYGDTDPRCRPCPDTECPFRDKGGFCPLEEEADYRAYRLQVHGALTGTSAF